MYLAKIKVGYIFYIGGVLMLSQVIANQLLQDIVDAYNYKDAPMLRRKLKNAQIAIYKFKTTQKGKKKGANTIKKCPYCGVDIPILKYRDRTYCSVTCANKDVPNKHKRRLRDARAMGQKEKTSKGNKN